MKTIDENTAAQLKTLQERIFSRSLPWQQTWRMIEALASARPARHALYVSAAQDAAGRPRVLGELLSSLALSWECVEVPPEYLAEGGIPAAARPPQPYRIGVEDEVLDLLVLTDVLEHLRDDRAFIAECHRVLKPSGRLVLVVRQARPWSLLRPVRAVLRVAQETRGRARPGYTESGLFDVLKDGFDVEEAQAYSRFFTQVAAALVESSLRISGIGHERSAGHVGDDERVLMAYRRAARSASSLYPLATAARGLDALLFASRGHLLAAVARRRQWRPRRTPALIDGRSIAEATINTKIGTASPF